MKLLHWLLLLPLQQIKLMKQIELQVFILIAKKEDVIAIDPTLILQLMIFQ